jgi:two-component system, response regulator PdtaR
LETNRDLKIYLCEDENVITMDLVHTLKSLGYKNITVFKSGELLVEKTREQLPDIIITDINLAGKMTGLDAIKIINETNNIPVIILSGLTDNLTTLEVKKINLCKFIPKPFDEESLMKALQDCVVNT